MLSVNTNPAAAQAMRALNDASTDVALHQQRITTGLRVNGTKDDSASYTIAQSLRSDALARVAIGKNMARASSVLDVAASGAEQISDMVNQIKSKAFALNGVADASARAAIRMDIEALVSQIDTVATSADFNGINLLAGKQAPLKQTTTTTTMSHSTYAVPTLPVMAALPQGTKLVNTSTTTFDLGTSPLTPASFATALGSLSGMDSQTVPFNAGTTAGRVLLAIDAYSVPDVIELWQNGVRVASTGNSYAPGGAAVAAGTPITGQALLAFDYDPSKGQDLEIRVNPNGSPPGTSWHINAMQLQDASNPIPSGANYQASSQLVALAPGTAAATATDPEQASQALNVPPENASASYTVNLGGQSGRVDVAFDAFGIGDTMEIWQNGVRVAATGQPYGAGGAAVLAGTAVTGKSVVSFDYDPSRGPVTFRFNPAGASADSAWAVTGVALNRTTDPVATVASNDATTSGSATVRWLQHSQRPQRGEHQIGSRDLTASGLGLDRLDWSEPSQIVDAVNGRAPSRRRLATSEARCGPSTRQLHSTRGWATFSTALSAIWSTPISRRSAALQAAQIKQQLAAKALSIANDSPRSFSRCSTRRPDQGRGLASRPSPLWRRL